ncbi:MAG: spermidine/putrescine ABC transporter substrate-binding protein [Pseudomonadota bacterium]|nr:spermidine/putrescine ABC transporter substrate-binding protein [Gammaproteobacteria bacterium]MBU1558436.1 spermidine/putrescine ABC transporter substrate-binding protein [Gammaproteobacteria bacterium]MBU1628696.1 spermidine/putrescine ABC transporter substrate-binding protein [Gammaproteobacteria bacterium]MBU1926473.1 spermidine/putrescine ABC transporter substrate-binding protein [Gammaproteobacteria bacterium]MBU2546429.1 spermidine/putrescine ABC transporter substrate-binding protein 
MNKRFFILFFCTVFPVFAFAQQRVLNVYNWSGYIPPKVLALFQKETGIRVNYSTFESEQTLYTKLKADQHAGYDLVVPSSDFVERMRKEGMLRKLDKKQLPNFRYLNPKLLNQSFDPQNQYSVPYLWGVTGMIANRKYYPEGSIQYWRDLWKPKYKGQISFTDDLRDAFSIGLIVSKYPVNDVDPEHIKTAYLKLRALSPNIRSFSSGAEQQMFVNEDANVGVIQNGDAHSVIVGNPNFYFIFPKDGPIFWVDSMVIPKYASHVKAAYQFMNFVLRPDVAKMIVEGVGFSTPNLGALRLMSPDMRNNRVINPKSEDLRNAQVEGYVPNQVNQLIVHYWQLLKLL